MPSIKNSPAPTLARNPWRAGTTQHWAPSTARKLQRDRIPITTANAAMCDHLGSELNRQRAAEIERAVATIYGTDVANLATSTTPLRPYDPGYLQGVASRAPANIDINWLRSNSPEDVDMSPGEYLDSVYNRGSG